MPSDGQADTPPDADIDAELDLHELIALQQRVDWRLIPGVTPAEAAAWTARLIEAAEQMPLGYDGGVIDAE